MGKYSCSLPSFFRKVERKNMAANYAKIRDGGKGAGLHYRTFKGFSKVVALKLRKLRREDFQIATRIREVGLTLPLLANAAAVRRSTLSDEIIDSAMSDTYK